MMSICSIRNVALIEIKKGTFKNIWLQNILER